MGGRINTIKLTISSAIFIALSTQSLEAAPTKKKPMPRPAPQAVDPVANLRAVYQYALFGKNCPSQTKQTTQKWTEPLKFDLVPGSKYSALLIHGTFTAGDSERLRVFLSSAGPIEEVRFDSGGGNAAEGPKVGRVIRNAKLATRIVTGYACISSCSMAFLGGILRKIDDGAIYGLHTFYSDNALSTIASRPNIDAQLNLYHQREQANALLAAEIQQYGQEMGISRRFFSEVMFAQRSLIKVSDGRVGVMRSVMRGPMAQEGAISFVKVLIADGVIQVRNDSDTREAADLIVWLLSAHTQEEVDRKIGELITATFRCESITTLAGYNVINVRR